MGRGTPLTLRTPLILLTVVDLMILGVRLWPWPEVANLPGNGSSGFDPAICLIGYIGAFAWLSSNHNEATQNAISHGTFKGLAAGVLLVVQVLSGMWPELQIVYLQIGLLCGAVVLWGIAGMRGARSTGNPSTGILSGLWSAMVSCLMACTAALAEINLSSPTQQTQDPWKQYQGLAIGNPAIQALVHALNASTAFLLLGPLIGAVAGLIFALMA